MSSDEDSVESDEEFVEELAAIAPVLASSSDAVTAKQGQVEIREKKPTIGKAKWKSRWAMVIKGSVHIFKNYEKTDPYITINMQGAEIIEYTGDGAREFCFGVKVGAEEPTWFAGSSSQEIAGWKDAITASKTQEPSNKPVREVIPKSKRTSTPLFRAKKSVAGKAATSKMGKVVLKKMFGEDIKQLLASVKLLVAKHASKDIANRTEKLLIRLMVKLAFQFEKKNLTMDSLVVVDRPLREAMEILSKYYNSRMRRYSKVAGESKCFVRVEELGREAEQQLSLSLQPYLTPKNMDNLHYLFDTLIKAKFLEAIFNDSESTEDLDVIDDAITSYTQFHF